MALNPAYLKLSVGRAWGVLGMDPTSRPGEDYKIRPPREPTSFSFIIIFSGLVGAKGWASAITGPILKPFLMLTRHRAPPAEQCAEAWVQEKLSLLPVGERR